MYAITLVHSCLCGYHNNKKFRRENRLCYSHVLTFCTASSFVLSLPTVALGIPYHVDTPAVIGASLRPLFTVSFTGIRGFL